jgi:signal transduction histidine kinase
VYHPVQVESLIRSTITVLDGLAKERNVKIKTRFPEKSRTIMVDSDRIVQVLINLLRNAVEASSPGGEVRVSVSFPSDISDVLFDDIRNLVIIEVEDDGVGFSEEAKAQIFEPFFTTKAEGTGLGLYVTHSIVERHGGYIFVESEKGKGAVFTVYLPVEKVQHGDSSQVSHPVSG